MKNFKIILLFLLLIFLFNCNSDDINKELTKESNENSSFSDASSTTSSLSIATQKYISSDSLNLKITPFIPDYPDLGVYGKQLLATRLNQAISIYGYGGNSTNPRFVIGPVINLLSKNITGTAPTKYANTYEVTLLSLDVVSEITFNSYTFQIKGVGDSPAKSFINAFRDYSFESEEFFNFLQQTQQKIAQYYNNNCDKLIMEAESEANARNYDVAFALLQSIPVEASTCFQKAMDKKKDFFLNSLNTNCQTILASMKAELGKSNDPSASGFNESAMSYYAMIDRSSSCYIEAEKFYLDYINKLNPKAKRDWDFKMKEYQDMIRRVESENQFRNDSTMQNFEYLKHKEEMLAKAEIEGNKKLLQKYQYDQLPWLRKVFHLGKLDPFDGVDK